MGFHASPLLYDLYGSAWHAEDLHRAGEVAAMPEQKGVVEIFVVLAAAVKTVQNVVRIHNEMFIEHRRLYGVQRRQ